MVELPKDVKPGRVVTLDWHGKRVQVMVMSVSEKEVVVQ